MLLVYMGQHPQGRQLDIAMSRIRLSAQRGLSGRGRVSAVAVHTDDALNSRLGLAETGVWSWPSCLCPMVLCSCNGWRSCGALLP